MFLGSLQDKSQISKLTARMLLEIGAVNFNVTTPYKLASGLNSPSYIDCRKIISYPRVRNSLMNFLSSLILQEVGFEKLSCVAGGETAGIPFSAMISERLSLPMAYVRKKPKGYGKNSKIEGCISKNDNVILIEDLTTDGASKLDFIDTIRATGASCNHTAVIFYYNIFENIEEKLLENKIKLHYLTDWKEILAQAKAYNFFNNATLCEVEAFLEDPSGWSNKNCS